MKKIKVLIKENKKIIKEGSGIDPNSLRALMDEMLAPDIDKKILINIEKGNFSIVRTDMSGRNLTWEPNGDVSINSNLDRNYLDFNADLDVGGFENKKKNPAFSRWLEQGQEVTKEVEKLVDLEYTKLSQPEYRRAVGDFRSNMQVILGMIKDTIVKGWKKIKVLFPRNWTNLRNRLYLKTMKYTPPKPKGIGNVGEEPKEQKPYLEATDKAAQKDLKQAQATKNSANNKVNRLEAKKNGMPLDYDADGKPKTRRSRRLDAKIKKFKARAKAAETLEDAISKALRSADIEDVAEGAVKKSGKFFSKLVSFVGWAVAGFVGSVLFKDCESLGATPREAATVVALDEGLVSSFLVPEMMDWFKQRLEGATLRHELARGKVGTKTRLGVFTSEDNNVLKRATAYHMRKIRKKNVPNQDVYKKYRTAYPFKSRYNVFEENLQRTGSTKTKVLKESNKIKIKINS